MFNRPGIMDEIRCDEKGYLIWKWRPKGSSNRENAIRWGSSLRVREGSVAVFVYRKRGENAVQEFIEGPFDKTHETSNLPIISSIVAAAYGGGTPFQAEVYFINLAKIIQTRFAVRYFDAFDPRFTDFGVPVAVRGTITFHIADYREFISLHRLEEFALEDFSAQIKDTVSRRVKTIVGEAPAKQGISLQQLSLKTECISSVAQKALSPTLHDTFGIELASLDISDIELDKTSAGYRQLMSVTRNVVAATVQAQTDADIKNIHDKQQIEIENLAERLRIEREESRYALHKQTQSSNFAAYQVEAQMQVGVAGAEALGHMGENGTSSVQMGGGMDMAGLTAGMALGGAIGNNLAGSFQTAATSSASDYASPATPPPIPGRCYFIAQGNDAKGPFSLDELKAMVDGRSLLSSSLIWKKGMAEWQAAESVSDVAALFQSRPSQTPPPIP